VSRRTAAAGDPARIDGGAATVEAGIERAANLLGRARRVLVTGLADATLEAIGSACDLAESLGAAIDAGDPDAASPLGPLVARAGGVSADREELRDRADLVIAWFCDPAARDPGFVATLIAPPRPDGRGRTVLAVGPNRFAAAARHVSLPADAAVAAARLLNALLLGHDVPADNPAAAEVAAACHDLATAIQEASCVAVITCRETDPLGLADWAARLLVRQIAHERPAFAVPLAAAAPGGLANAAGAAAILTWRYAAAGAIRRADRLGAGFRPAECSAAAMVTRGECDAVLAVGRLPAEVEEAIASRAADLAVVRICVGDDEPPGCAGPSVHLRCGPPAGTILRGDGREQAIGNPAASTGTGSMAALIDSLHARLVAGGRP